MKYYMLGIDICPEDSLIFKKEIEEEVLTQKYYNNELSENFFRDNKCSLKRHFKKNIKDILYINNLYPLHIMVSANFLKFMSKDIIDNFFVKLESEKECYIFIPYVIENNNFNFYNKNNKDYYEVRNHLNKDIIAFKSQHHIFVSQRFKNLYEKSGLKGLYFQLYCDTDRPCMSYQDLYMEENNINIFDHTIYYTYVKKDISFNEAVSIISNNNKYIMVYQQYSIEFFQNDFLLSEKIYDGSYRRAYDFDFCNIPQELKEKRWSLMIEK